MAHARAAVLVFSSAAFGGMPASEVEKVYWDCEFMATEGRISLDHAAGCSELYEHLKKEKFGGEFERFLVWWKANKERERLIRSAPVRLRDGLRDD